MRRMQHKRSSSKTPILLGLLVVALAGGVVAVAMVKGPMPQPVEKELDAKAFLGEKQ